MRSILNETQTDTIKNPPRCFRHAQKFYLNFFKIVKATYACRYAELFHARENNHARLKSY